MCVYMCVYICTCTIVHICIIICAYLLAIALPLPARLFQLPTAALEKNLWTTGRPAGEGLTRPIGHPFTRGIIAAINGVAVCSYSNSIPLIL